MGKIRITLPPYPSMGVCLHCQKNGLRLLFDVLFLSITYTLLLSIYVI